MTEPVAVPIAGPVPLQPAPGWTSSEFISTIAVHLLNLTAILLDMLHVNWKHGLSSFEAAIPMAALLISAVLQAMYQNHRTALKIEHVAKVADVRVAQVKAEVAAMPSSPAASQAIPDPAYFPSLGVPSPPPGLPSTPLYGGVVQGDKIPAGSLNVEL